MKEFDFDLKEIFAGLYAALGVNKKSPGLEECHNLEPIDGDYKVHQLVTDLNATGITWGGESSEDDFFEWKDDQGDEWKNDQNDIWIDE